MVEFEEDGPEHDTLLATRRRVVDAFFAASRDGDFDALVEVLDPDVELRIDGGVLRVAPHGRAFSVMAFTVKNGKIVQIDALLDPERLEQLELSIPPRIEHR